MCMTIPTKGIQARHDVTIPRICPVFFLFSFDDITSDTMCRANMIKSGVQYKLTTIAPPSKGMPSNASNPPDTHFNTLELLQTIHLLFGKSNQL